MYETMIAWDTDPTTLGERSAVMLDFAQLWQSAAKIVYSTTLATVSTTRTRIARDFEPVTVRQVKVVAEHDLTVGGPGLASHALKAGLVDECQLFVAPIVVGGGTRFFPSDIRVTLELLDERRFGNGMVYLRYRTIP